MSLGPTLLRNWKSAQSTIVVDLHIFLASTRRLPRTHKLVVKVAMSGFLESHQVLGWIYLWCCGVDTRRRIWWQGHPCPSWSKCWKAYYKSHGHLLSRCDLHSTLNSRAFWISEALPNPSSSFQESRFWQSRTRHLEIPGTQTFLTRIRVQVLYQLVQGEETHLSKCT